MDAFKNFDFEKDDRWKAFLKNVEIPAGDNDAAMLKLKARFYKRTIDPDFDVSSVSSASKATQAPKASTAAPEVNTSGSSQSSGAYARPQGPPPPPPPRYGSYGSTGRGGATYGNERWQRWLFFLHLGLLGLSVFVMVPFLPYGRLAYVYFMRLTVVTSLMKIFLQHGLPPFRPFSMLTAWFQRVMPTTDFLQVIIALIFSAQPPMVLVAAPPAVLAAYHASAYAAAHFQNQPLWQRYGSRVHNILMSRQQDALQLNAFCEVATLFMLVLHLLTPARSFLALMLYSQILKLKLHVPDSAPQQRQVWQKIDQVTLPYRLKVPAVERLIGLGVKWFMSVPGAR